MGIKEIGTWKPKRLRELEEMTFEEDVDHKPRLNGFQECWDLVAPVLAAAREIIRGSEAIDLSKGHKCAISHDPNDCPLAELRDALAALGTE